MIIIKYTGRVDFEYDIQGLLRTFFPGESMVTDREAEADLILEAEFYDYFEKIPMVLRLEGKPYTEGDFKRESERTFRREGSFLPGSVPVAEENPEGDSIIFREDYDRVRKETKNRLKRLLFNLLKEYTGKTPVWGTLSGIRPTKITSSYLEQGYSEAEAKQRFMREYYVSGEKAEQCVNISRKEAEILKDIDYKNGYSLYIGIPFCPSTCLYCSFTSYPLSKYRTKTDAYIEALGRELEYIAEACADREPDTIYIGGGTPTTLEPYQLDSLLGIIHELFNTKAVSEFTVEAGRPDSITQEKLKVLGTYDVSRISINPQTMNQKTLDIIGRHHTMEDFLRAYDMARTNGFENINMDFILGLPDETEEDVRRSMEWVERLKPDSLTIHSLALKRAARLNILKEQYEQYTIENSDEIMEITRQTAKKLDLTPYYLYRQKNMAGNLENIGYAKDGKAGIYNILIMEEKQTILAAGAGSSTKMVHPDGMKITRIENVKDVDLYISDIDKMIERKRSFFEKRNVDRKEWICAVLSEENICESVREPVMHGICVSNLAYKLAVELGMEESGCYELSVAGMLHDIGKMRLISCVYREEEETLTVEQMRYIRMHPKLGFDILKDRGFSDFILESILYHHENYDGSGYPENLSGENIPMGARILRVCDVFAALISDRSYRRAFDRETAVELMIDEVKNFDMEIFLAFMRIIHDVNLDVILGKEERK